MGNVLSAGFANDIIVVRQPDGTLRCSPVNVRFAHQDDVTNWNEKNVTVSINDIVLNLSLNELNPRDEPNDGGFRFTSPCLKSMRLRDEMTHITFTIKVREQDVEVKARMFLWRSDSRIVITDVDGTITKSDVRGILQCLFGFHWNHYGVCRLFSEIEKNGYKVIYLTGRPRYWAKATRGLLDGMKQDDGKVTKFLPKGPVIVSPDGLRASFRREVRKTQDTDLKIPMLKPIRKLFPKEPNPFHAGFGNRPSDASTYRHFKIPDEMIFHLNGSKGEIQVKCDTKTVCAIFPNSYGDLYNFVYNFFPKVPAPAGRVKGYIKSWYHTAGKFF